MEAMFLIASNESDATIVEKLGALSYRAIEPASGNIAYPSW
jgi:hypothetical protein